MTNYIAAKNLISKLQIKGEKLEYYKELWNRLRKVPTTTMTEKQKEVVKKEIEFYMFLNFCSHSLREEG